ncbi:MAG: MBOAT family protein [Dysgonamonadaceae bacterium]|jgi:D-alanyl-lipoteichoic acid acyltransferase DltB (MBOAT superfamily)|nr:MBOAT family protein [Dysgonamonadaceae bacterium]
MQNILLVAASYFFYGSWDWRFLFLLIFSTAINYFAGLRIWESDSQSKKKVWLVSGIVVNLGFLGFFKYYNFFIESFADLLNVFGINSGLWTLKIILPVGISFYTFHGLSYILDIYNRRIEPTRNVIDYSLFVCFFPLLVAGPVERATHLLPQLKKPRTFLSSNVTDGLKQILWGLFKKMVVADNCAVVVDQIFDNYSVLPANTLLLGAILGLIQIYCDFSGYSDIALGSARLLGIELLQNFNYPLFASSVSDYWKRNHISMTTWFMDYIYYPLTDRGNSLRYWNACIIITFILSGLWHGANWTFIVWGGIHGLMLVVSINSSRRRRKFEKKYNLTDNGFYRFARIVKTFMIVAFVGILFRGKNLTEAVSYMSNIFSASLFSPSIGEFNTGKKSVLIAIVLSAIMFLVEWNERREEKRREEKRREEKRREEYYTIRYPCKKKWQRYSMYYAIILAIILYAGKGQQFVYFQF